MKTVIDELPEDKIGYAELIDNAMRGVVRDTLERVAENGLPGDHHCYISFKTHFPGVQMADYLRERYPEEMTIVLQHQFWDLTVSDDFFSVSLSFNRTRENLLVPYDALTAFADPSIKFGLQFQHKDLDDGDGRQHHFDQLLDGDDAAGAKVIALDAFRNKQNNDDD